MPDASDPTPDLSRLTQRQLQVLELVAKGLTNSEVSAVLGISPGTVKVHLAAIYRGLEVSNRTEAAVAFSELQAPAAGDAAAGGTPAAVGGAGGEDDGFGLRPAIAVLPFDDLSDAAGAPHLADGLVEDITTRLSYWRWIPVISRQSSFQFRGIGRDLARVGRELGARYLVEGSVRRDAERARVTVQLIDAERDVHLWARSFDGDLSDVFAFQDRASLEIVASLFPEVAVTERQRAAHPLPGRLDAWELAVRGQFHLMRRTREDNEAARDCCARALALDARSLLAAHGLGMSHYADLFRQWTRDPAASLAGLHDAARRAMEIDARDAYALVVYATSRMLQGDRAGTIEAVEGAIECNPSSAQALSFLGQLYAMTGRVEDGIALLQEAIRLSPRDPLLFSFHASIGLSYMMADRLEEARASLLRGLDARPEEEMLWASLASVEALLGQGEAARAAVERLRALRPDYTLAAFRRVAVLAIPEYMERFARGLLDAGFRDPEPA